MSAQARKREIPAEFEFRRPESSDGPALHQLVANCPPLDLNSVYAYLLVCDHFAETSVVVERDGELVGLISGYIPPERPHTLFVWQVAVGESARGEGLAGRMLNALLARPVTARCRYVETTVTPSNQASERTFRSLSRRLHCDCQITDLYSSEQLGEGEHEPERLFRIGPFLNHYRSNHHDHAQHRRLQPTRIQGAQLLPEFSRRLPRGQRSHADG